MKAISLWQPWASLLVLGEKQIETRSWATPHRGPLAVHAAKMWNPDLERLCMEEPFRSLLLKHGLGKDLLPRGALVGTVQLDNCLPTDLLAVKEVEYQLGDFRAGRFAWIVSRPQPLIQPIPTRGKQGIFTIELELASKK
jgi:hypothetical protein